MTNVLVTGGSGFIGSNLACALACRGAKVKVFDNHFRNTGRNLEVEGNQVEVIKGDIRDRSDVFRASKGMDTIFHLAYINGTEYFYNEPRLVLEVGAKGTLNVLDAAIDSKVSNFIFASSSEVYQSPWLIPTPENIPLTIPDVKNARFSYGGGKILGELLTLHYTQNIRMRRIIFRPHNVYGPQMGWEHVIPQLIKKVYLASSGFKKERAAISIQGSGEESRSFCYIDDAIEGILTCAEKGEDREIYNVGMSDEISINGLVREIGNMLKIKITTQSEPLKPGSAKRRCPDINKLKKLGFRPKVSLREGLRRTIEHYKERLSNEQIEF